jgi:hypothetical protein
MGNDSIGIPLFSTGDEVEPISNSSLVRPKEQGDLIVGPVMAAHLFSHPSPYQIYWCRHHTSIQKMARKQGLEPQFAESKSAVLPLDDFRKNHFFTQRAQRFSS